MRIVKFTDRKTGAEGEIIDPEDMELNGQKISVIPELICEEVLMYISLI